LKEKKEEGEERRRANKPKTDNKSKRETFEAVEGMGIHFVYPDAEEGLRWHSRINAGLLEINIANSDFMEAEKRGQTFLARYLTLLLQVELTTVSIGDHQGEIFHTGFELMLDQFFALSLRD